MTPPPDEPMKACPWCGRTNLSFERSIGIYCDTCEIWFGTMDMMRESAIRKWNRRAPPATAHEGEREALMIAYRNHCAAHGENSQAYVDFSAGFQAALSWRNQGDV